MSEKETKKELENELRKRAALRLSNAESNRLTRECIRTALIFLMRDTPFDKITITAIINRSGVSRAAFYRNYSSKEDVLLEIGRRLSEKISKSLTDEKYLHNPHQWYADCFADIKNNSDYFKLFIEAKMPPDFIFHLNSLSEDIRSALSPKEYYKRLALESAVKEIIVAWFKHGMEESPEEMADICMELFS